jgi:hypothetical protein
MVSNDKSMGSAVLWAGKPVNLQCGQTAENLFKSQVTGYHMSISGRKSRSVQFCQKEEDALRPLSA